MTRAWKEVPDDATKFPIYHFPGEVEELEIKFWPLTKRQTIMRALQRAQGETVELACDDVFALLELDALDDDLRAEARAYLDADADDVAAKERLLEVYDDHF